MRTGMLFHRMLIVGLLVGLSATAWASRAAQKSGTALPRTPISAFLNQVEEQTGYRIELVGHSDGAIIASWPGDAPIADAVAHLLRQLDSTNHIVVIDSALKIARITLVSAAPIAPAPEEKTPLINQPSSYGTALLGSGYLSADEMAAIKEDYLESLADQHDDTEVSPPTEDGPGLRIAELEEAKFDYDDEKAVEDDDALVSPGDQEGDGITRAELRIMKSSYRRSLLAADAHSAISPPSDYGEGMSAAELADIKQVYFETLAEPGDRITPDSNLGPGLTIEEVNAAKAAYMIQTGRIPSDSQSK